MVSGIRWHIRSLRRTRLAVEHLSLANAGITDYAALQCEPREECLRPTWSPSSVIADERIFGRSISERRNTSEEWQPKTLILKDLKRLQSIQRLPSGSSWRAGQVSWSCGRREGYHEREDFVVIQPLTVYTHSFSPLYLRTSWMVM